MQECPRPPEILSTVRAPVIDAEKNISTNPSSGFYYEISTPAFLFFPKVKPPTRIWDLRNNRAGATLLKDMGEEACWAQWVGAGDNHTSVDDPTAMGW